MDEPTGPDGVDYEVAFMPRYKCHKEVRAVKIFGIDYHQDGSATVHPVDDGDSFVVSADYLRRYKPEAGGYYVVYADGYKSFSPAKAFEDGYSLISS